MTSEGPPRFPATTAAAGADPALGMRIGVYRLVSVLGEGGMGIVYLAEQEHPMRRRVALKLIKLGMDTREVLARFDSERQALALMTHPNIAKVFDAGRTEHGRPYFVMEYVPGISITEYCDQQRLTNRGRLELFIAVCEALHHAHQKGIVHRDLKPANILVSIQDGRPVPHIIDFGIAKALHQKLVEATIFTQRGLLIGTPQYMSPEQAAMNALDIDTASDVYSLGVVLYELLVGSLPFEPAQLRNASYDEIRRIIQEENIVRPSTRLMRMGVEAKLVADRHQTDTRVLYRELRGDLDWVTLKAIEKDRTRRYPSASEFAADIRRYLADEPVVARPPSAAYRLQKLYKRRRGAVFAALLLIGSLGVGLAASLFLYAKAHQASIRAEREAYVASIRAADLSFRSGDVVEARYRLDQAPVAMRGWEWRHLASRLDSSTRVLKAALPVHHVAFSGGHELSAFGQRFGERWRRLSWSADAVTATTVTEPRLPDNMMSHLEAVSVDNSFVLASDAVIIRQPGGFTMKDMVLRIYDGRSGNVVGELGHAGVFSVAAFSPDGKRVVLAGEGGLPTLQIWDISGRTLVGPRHALPAGPRCVAFSPNRVHLAVAAAASIFVFDSQGIQRFVFNTQKTDGPCTLAFSPDSSLLLMVPSTGPGLAQGRVWELSSGRLVGLLEDNWWTAAAFSPDGRTVAIGAWDGRIQILDVPRFDQPSAFRPHASSTFFGHRARVHSLAFSSDAVSLASGSADGTVRVWDTRSTGEYRAFRAEGAPLSALSMSGDGARMASAEGVLARIWHTRPFETITRTARHEAHITAIALNADGSKLATGTVDGTVRLWSVADSIPTWTFKAHQGRVNALTIHPDAGFLASASKEHHILLWDTRSKQAVRVLEGHEGSVNALITADGQTIISGSEDSTVRIWSVPDTRLIRTLKGHGAAVMSVAISPDGHRVVSSSGDRTARIWARESGAEIAVLRGHSEAVMSAVFNSDGTRIVTASLDRTIRVWDSTLGVPLITLSNGEELPSSVLLLRDDGRLVAASHGGTFRSWESTPTSVVATEAPRSPSEQRYSGGPPKR